MRVLIVGSGAREHALAWKLRQSPRVTDLFVAPGNGGTAAIAINLPVQAMDFDGIVAVAKARHIDLVVVGPDDPLAGGLVDTLTGQGITTYGPSRAAARLEWSKSFAKEIMARAGIPTAEARVFDDAEAALRYLDDLERTGRTPPVVKADGLALGKGVTVASTFDEARAAVQAAMVTGVFGASGRRVLLEERLIGVEVSAHAFCDGRTAVPMAYACDYKRAHDGDAGPNTGGMGAYSPPGFVDAALHAEIARAVLQPLMDTMAAAGAPYRGTLYPGLMLTADGPRVVEFNARFGDPEAQVLLPRLNADLLAIMLACVDGRLEGVDIAWHDQATVGVVLASGGYPGAYETGFPITGLDQLDEEVQVFHAGTRRADDGTLVTAGGRVLTVVATGVTIAEAHDRAYRNAERVRFQGRHFRRDIASRELTGAAAR